jgi:hypothetical protein
MSKAFVKDEAGEDDDADVGTPALPAAARNYITPSGYRRMRDELARLVKEERPEVVRAVSWAASNGDRSENGDYIYGKGWRDRPAHPLPTGRLTLPMVDPPPSRSSSVPLCVTSALGRNTR